MNVRAKVRCTEATNFGGTLRRYKFNAVSDDGTPENKRYHKYSPNGLAEFTVDNPEVYFQPGECYYLDFSPVAVPVAEPEPQPEPELPRAGAPVAEPPLPPEAPTA
jgi:hypothetical protein